jgi:hypothetical protein
MNRKNAKKILTKIKPFLKQFHWFFDLASSFFIGTAGGLAVAILLQPTPDGIGWYYLGIVISGIIAFLLKDLSK